MAGESMANRDESVTRLLRAWGDGDAQARDDLVPLVYAELRRRAAAYLRTERRDHTLQPTALVHEAYLRLLDQSHVSWQNRAHFFGLAARMMRRVLVDHARRRRAIRHGGAGVRVSLTEGVGAVPVQDCDLILLDQALEKLASLDARQAQIVELRYFGGLSEEEAATHLSISRSTVKRDWQTARFWLYRRMTGGREG